VRDFFFYALCAVMLALAALTVLARNLFRAALALLGVLLGTAVLFLLLQAELVALVQVMVYIGGIMIFVLYAVLLTSELGGKMPAPSPLKIATGLAVAAVGLGLLAGLAQKIGAGSHSAESRVGSAAVGGSEDGANIASMTSLGGRLLDPNGFLVPFELISVLLLAAMVGAIAVARQDGAAPKVGDAPGAGSQGARP
jgi:NADH-quinone oxidoreductase subunit J